MPYLATIAEVAELADALDSKSSVVTLRAGSSPAFGTIENIGPAEFLQGLFLRNFCLKNHCGHMASQLVRQYAAIYIVKIIFVYWEGIHRLRFVL